MRASKRIVLVLAAGLFSTSAISAGAAGLAPKKPSEIRTLQNNFAAPQACPAGPGKLVDVQINSDGSQVSFAIPEGQVLIVTGWQFAEGETGSEATLYISAPSPTGFSTSQSVTSDSHVQLSPGVVVK